MKKNRIIILGAAGRDFHNFNVLYRHDPNTEVVAFTATQIPDIAGRKYPAALAGEHYPQGIPIEDEAELEELIRKENVDECLLSYSDLSYSAVMHLASRAIAAGATFAMAGAGQTMLKSTKPIIAVVAVRTGSGKSQTSRAVLELLSKAGKKAITVRHPMPYGDIEKQRVQRFATYQDLIDHDCTIEEMEEYEPYVSRGFTIYAGVDYAAILEQAEEEADLVLWDGGNNDTPFYKPDLTIVVADPLRAGHEVQYYPGEVNFRMADTILINKIDSAKADQIETVEENARKYNPEARIIKAESDITVESPELIKGKRVLVIEDGPTLTHGDMKTGAGTVAAQRNGATEIIDPRPFATGTIKRTFDQYPEIGKLLPAMGYGKQQMQDLEATINASDCDTVVIGTPIELTRYIDINKDTTRVRYELSEAAREELKQVLAEKGFL